MTQIIKINPINPNIKDIRKAAALIRKGEIIAFPTETVYGLGANALNVNAVKKIFEAKGRPSDNPFIVHIAFESDLQKIVKDIPEKANILIKKFWPGPLTLVFEKKKIIPDEVTAGLSTVAVRMPSNLIAHKLIAECKTVIAAPSANLSGKPSPTSAKHVYNDLKGKIPLLLDGGHTDIGLESTVLDMNSEIPTLLRPGKITKEEIEKEIGTIAIHSSILSNKKVFGHVSSPGMKYRHYSPDAQLILVNGSESAVEKKIREIISENSNKRIAVLSLNPSFISLENSIVFKNKEALAHSLFDIFRDADERKIDIILVEATNEEGLGLAIMNRLIRAAFDLIQV